MANKTIPLGQWSGSDATDRLRATIEAHQKESAEQTRVMVRLTWWMTALTVVTVLASAVQIFLAWRAV